jgi:hypothetical protein
MVKVWLPTGIEKSWIIKSCLEQKVIAVKTSDLIRLLDWFIFRLYSGEWNGKTIINVDQERI